MGLVPAANGDLHLVGYSQQYGEEIYRIAGTPDPVPGDVDSDLDVDFADFLVLSANFGKEVDEAIADGDFDLDGKVDFADYLLLAEYFGENLKRPL